MPQVFDHNGVFGLLSMHSWTILHDKHFRSVKFEKPLINTITDSGTSGFLAGGTICYRHNTTLRQIVSICLLDNMKYVYNTLIDNLFLPSPLLDCYPRVLAPVSLGRLLPFTPGSDVLMNFTNSAYEQGMLSRNRSNSVIFGYSYSGIQWLQ